MKGWERLLANLGLPNVASWNLSLYQGVSFTYRRLVCSLFSFLYDGRLNAVCCGSQDGRTLLEDMKGKLVIFFNNNYSLGAEDTKEAIHDLPAQVLEASFPSSRDEIAVTDYSEDHIYI